MSSKKIYYNKNLRVKISLGLTTGFVFKLQKRELLFLWETKKTVFVNESKFDIKINPISRSYDGFDTQTWLTGTLSSEFVSRGMFKQYFEGINKRENLKKRFQYI